MAKNTTIGEELRKKARNRAQAKKVEVRTKIQGPARRNFDSPEVKEAELRRIQQTRRVNSSLSGPQTATPRSQATNTPKFRTQAELNKLRDTFDAGKKDIADQKVRSDRAAGRANAARTVREKGRFTAGRQPIARGNPQSPEGIKARDRAVNRTAQRALNNAELKRQTAARNPAPNTGPQQPRVQASTAAPRAQTNVRALDVRPGVPAGNAGAPAVSGLNASEDVRRVQSAAQARGAPAGGTILNQTSGLNTARGGGGSAIADAARAAEGAATTADGPGASSPRGTGPGIIRRVLNRGANAGRALLGRSPVDLPPSGGGGTPPGPGRVRRGIGATGRGIGVTAGAAGKLFGGAGTALTAMELADAAPGLIREGARFGRLPEGFSSQRANRLNRFRETPVGTLRGPEGQEFNPLTRVHSQQEVLANQIGGPEAELLAPLRRQEQRKQQEAQRAAESRIASFQALGGNVDVGKSLGLDPAINTAAEVISDAALGVRNAFTGDAAAAAEADRIRPQTPESVARGRERTGAPTQAPEQRVDTGLGAPRPGTGFVRNNRTGRVTEINSSPRVRRQSGDGAKQYADISNLPLSTALPSILMGTNQLIRNEEVRDRRDRLLDSGQALTKGQERLRSTQAAERANDINLAKATETARKNASGETAKVLDLLSSGDEDQRAAARDGIFSQVLRGDKTPAMKRVADQIIVEELTSRFNDLGPEGAPFGTFLKTLFGSTVGGGPSSARAFEKGLKGVKIDKDGQIMGANNRPAGSLGTFLSPDAGAYFRQRVIDAGGVVEDADFDQKARLRAGS